MTLDKIVLALHVYGAILWIGGLFAVIAFLEAYAAETDPAARGRLAKFVRSAAIVPDVGATIAIVMGVRWLYHYKLYEAHYMHGKLAVVVVLIAMQVWLRRKVRAVKNNETIVAPPMFAKPLLSLLAIAILVFVITKVPA